MSRLAAVACSLFLVAPLFAAEPVPKVPDGFKCEIVLEAPDIEAPTALCVAPNGDVYFAEDPMDMSGPPTKNLDKIWMLKGGDPKKKILIAEKMWAVMGLEIVRDKLYVVHAPHVTVFTLDADGKPTKREELFDDLGPPVAGVPSFNDHIPSGIRMGMDGWLYVSIGDKGIPKMTRKEKDQGSVHVAEGRWRHTKEGHFISLEGGGVIRFRPDGSGLEVFASGTRNILDVPMDEHDRIFVRDNTDDGDGWNTRFMYLPRGGFMGYPWAFKQRPAETLPMIHDFGGGSPCGGYVYCDDGLPEKYRGRIFHCEWGQGKVWAVKVAPDGAGFKYVDEIAFMDPTGTGVKDFRPFSIRPTADGRGFYVTDWGFSGWLQKVKRGRLYKVTYTKDDVKPQPRGKDTDSFQDLVKALSHPAHSERLRAQRELVTRLPDHPAYKRDDLVQFRKDATALMQDPTANSAAKRHLLWVQLGLDVRAQAGLDGDQSTTARLARLAMKDADVGVRIEAVRVCGRLTNASEVILQGLKDKDAQVRLQAAAALGTAHLPNLEVRRLEDLDEADPAVRQILARSLKARQLDRHPAERFVTTKSAAFRELLFLEFADEYDVLLVKEMAKALADAEDATIRRQLLALLARVYKDRKPYPGTW